MDAIAAREMDPQEASAGSNHDELVGRNIEPTGSVNNLRESEPPNRSTGCSGETCSFTWVAWLTDFRSCPNVGTASVQTNSRRHLPTVTTNNTALGGTGWQGRTLSLTNQVKPDPKEPFCDLVNHRT